MEKRKIVIITDGPSPYRVAHYTFLQSNYKNYDFYIIFATKRSKSELRKWRISTDELKNVHYLSQYTVFIRKKYDNRQIFITYGVYKVLNGIVPDAVVCMEYNPTSIQTMFWCNRKRVPYISLTDGTLHSERNIGRMQRLSRKYIMRNASAFIASSTKAKEKIQSYGVNKAIYVSFLTEDIDKYLIQKQASGNTNLLYVGSLIERKGVDLLFIALAQMQQDWNLKIVGTGILENELREQAIELGIDARIEFLGYKQQDELVQLYKQTDVFILPTREDCYGLVILEAMCASLPVVCSKYADGAYDLIDDGVSGYLVDPYDASRFAAKIMEALNRNQGNNKMGIAAYEKAKTFSFGNVSGAFITAIEETINKFV